MQSEQSSNHTWEGIEDKTYVAKTQIVLLHKILTLKNWKTSK